MLHIRK